MKKALVCGINNYIATGMDLSGCVNDALDWRDALQHRGYDAKTLTDSQASGRAIREAIRDLLVTSQMGDELVVQYSGHGTRVPDLNGDEADGWDEAIVPCDVMAEGVITDDELGELFGNRPQGVQLTVIMDSCHSGTVSRFALETDPLGPHQPTVRYMPPETFMGSIMDGDVSVRAGKPPGRKFASLLLAGCQDFEYSYDAWFAGRANGAFSRIAIDALKTLPAGSTYIDWHRAIRRLLPSSRYPQTPMLYGTTARRRRPVLE